MGEMSFRVPGRTLLRSCPGLLATGTAILALSACGSGSGPEQGAEAASATQVAAAPPATVTSSSGTTVPRDAEEAQSFALSERQQGAAKAPAPGEVKPVSDPGGASGSDGVSPGAPSDEDIKQELALMDKAVAEQQKAAKAGGGRLTLGTDGHAQAPAGAPEVIQRIVSGANAISHFPYVYGGGHASFIDSAYDCSGSLSYAFAAGGILRRTMTSGELAEWGDPGQGKWITIFANETHTFMYVGGLRYDTSGRAGPLGSRWQTAPRSLAGFTVRHPKGL